MDMRRTLLPHGKGKHFSTCTATVPHCHREANSGNKSMSLDFFPLQETRSGHSSLVLHSLLFTLLFTNIPPFCTTQHKQQQNLKPCKSDRDNRGNINPERVLSRGETI